MTGRPQQVILIERHDPDQIVLSNPRENKNTTRLEDLKSRGPDAVFARSDIALINRYDECPTCHADTKHTQYAVYATKDGGITGDGVKFLDEYQRTMCLVEAKKLVDAAAIHPEMGVYLS